MIRNKQQETRQSKRIATRKALVARRRAHVKKRFKELYDVKRIRYDDCIRRLANELFVSEATIERDLAG